MHTGLNYRVDAMLDGTWAAWVDLFAMIPFWDPYGALASVFLAIIAAAYLVRMLLHR